MKKLNQIQWTLVSLFLFLFVFTANGQSGLCTANTPFYTVDLTSSASATWTSTPPIVRAGSCCGSSFPDRCIEFQVTLNKDAVAINFEIASGAVPTGAMYYKIGCGPPTKVGEPICITGPGPHTITFCKPGSNLNTYRITSIPGPTGGPDVTTSDGCTATFNTYGLTGVTWTDITSGNGQYNAYLSCTSCTSTTVTPQAGYPAYVDYQVCGMPNLGPCAPAVMFCDTVRAYFISPIQNSINPNPAKYCQGTSGVNLTAVVNGGKAPYSYIWKNQAAVIVGTTSSYFATTTGTYNLEIRDALYPTCPSKFASTSVSIEPPPTANAGNDVTICASNATVALQGSVTNSNNYSWSGSGSFGSALNSLSNTYTPTAGEILAGKAVLKLTANGISVCAAAVDSMVITIKPILDVSISGPSLVCYGEKANLNATISGGTPAYNFSWNTGSTSTSLTNLSAGTYTASVTDASFNTCSDVASITITENPLLTLSVPDTVIIYCQSNTSVTATAAGGNGIYNYSWTSGDNTATANLYVGNYNVTVSDGEGCSVTKSTVVTTQSSNLSVSMQSIPNLCYGASGTITPNVSSGFTPYTYLWNTGEQTLSKTATAGTYCITVTDSAGCVAAACITLNQDSLLIANISGPAMICNAGAGTIIASATGGKTPYSYLWNTGENTASINKNAGTYTVTVSDANSSTCTANKSFTINQSTPLNLSLNATNISCFGGSNGSVSANVSGSVSPYTYSWNPGGASTSSISGLPIGKYKVTVTSNLGCTKSDSVTLTQPTALVVSIPTKTNVSCFGGNNGTAQSSVSGGTAPYTYSWGTSGETTPNATQLIAGTHTLTVTDAKGCTKTATVAITQPTALTLSNSITSLSCKNSNNGKITIIGSGGTRPYTYVWSPNMSADSVANNLAAGVYSTQVTDAKGCVKSISSTVIEPDSLKFTLSGNNISCYNGSNGSISPSVSGGTTPYAYAWSNGKTSSTNTSLIAGTYSLTVTDAKGCAYTKGATLTQPTEIIVNVSPNSYIRCDSLGKVYAWASGGTGSLNYLWSNGVSNDTAGVSNSGSYVVTVSDANGCSKTATAYVIPLLSTLSVNISGPTHICHGSSATLTRVISPGIAPYRTLWNNGDTTASITSTGGNSCVTITDDAGCVYSACVNVIEDPLLQVSSTSDSVCFSAQTTISASASGGLAPYNYSWSTGGSGSSITKGGGTHTVTVSDATGCTATSISTVTEGTPLLVNMIEGNISCYGYSDGWMESVVSGSFSPYTYLWSNNVTTSGIYNLPVGNYSVTVSDNLGCSASVSGAVSGPSGALYPKYTAKMVSCFGGSNGSATASAIGGLAPYSYLWWKNGETTATINGLTAGTYGLSITDSLGCVRDTQVVITQPSALALSITPVMITCKNANNGKATALVSGGTRPYSYQWPVINKTDSAVNSLAPGTYTVNVTDAKGCTISKTVTITEPDSLKASITSQNVSCFGGNNGSASVAATGGTPTYSYLWSNNSTLSIANILIAGTYSVTVSDTKGCTYTLSKTITQPTALVSSIGTPQHISCNGFSDGKATATASGGTAPYTYAWAPSNENTLAATQLVAGTNTFKVTDSKGCISTKTVVITQPTLLNTSFTSSNITCKGSNNGSAQILVGGGTSPYSYLWQNNNSTNSSQSALAQGKYVVKVSDANGCVKKDSIVISEPDSLLITNLSGSNVSCYDGNNGSASSTVQGGTTPYTYQWSNGSSLSSINGLTAGSYSLAVSDNKGCSFSKSVLIEEPTQIITSVSPDTYIRCDSSGIVYGSASGGTGSLSYLWSTGVQNDSSAVINSGTYLFTVTDSLGCVATDTAFVKPLGSSLQLTLNSPAHFCYGDSATISSTIQPGIAPFSLVWSTGDTSSTIKVAAGSYFATVTDAAQCAYTAYINVVEDPSLQVSLANDTVCFGANATLNAIAIGGYGTYSYSWNTSGSSASMSKAKGTHVVTVTDATGCVASDTAEVSERTEIEIDVIEKGITCFGYQDGQLSASATGSISPYSFAWNNGDTTAQISNLLAGTFIVTVSDSKGCVKTKSALVDGSATPLKVNIVSANVSCYGLTDGSIDLQVSGGKGGYQYTWSNNAGNTKLNSNLSEGPYSFSVSDSLGCSIDSAVLIQQPNPLQIELSATMITCKDANNGSAVVMATGGNQPYQYHWLPNNSNDSITQNLFPGTHQITVTDARGCSVDSSVVITQPDSLLASISNTSVSCFGGSDGTAGVTASGGTSPYNYLWSDNSTSSSISNKMAGNYTITISDSKACTYQKTIKISQPTKLNVNATVLENISCNGLTDGSAFAIASGGIIPYTYNWTPSNENNDSAFALPKGTNTVSVLDSAGCAASATVIISEPTVISTQINQANISCKGGNNGSATVVVSGGSSPYTYDWQHDHSSLSSVSSLSAGTYKVVISDAHSCVKEDSVVITEPDSLLIFSLNKQDVSCFGGNNGSVNAQVIGGTSPYQYQWSNGASSANISNLSIGNYTLTVTDDKGCNVSEQAAINQPSKIVVSVSPNQYISCDSTGTVYASANGGTGTLSFLWSNGVNNDTAAVNNSGSYVVTVSDSLGCTMQETAYVKPLGSALLLSLSGPAHICFGDSAQLTSSITPGIAPFHLLWNTGDTTASIKVKAGSYSATVTDASTCKYTASVEVVEDPLLQISVANDTVCFGVQASLNAAANGGYGVYTYAWSGGGNSATVNKAKGNYKVEVQDETGCTASDSVSVIEGKALQLSFITEDVSCFGMSDGSSQVNISGGFSPYVMQWANNVTDSINKHLIPGIYNITVHDAQNCIATEKDTVGGPTQALNIAFTSQNVSCFGGQNGSINSTITGGTSPYHYLWKPNGENVANINSLVAGDYELVVVDDHQCGDSSIQKINEAAQLLSSISSIGASCFGKSDGSAEVNVSGGTAPYNYQWSSGDQQQQALGLAKGLYIVEVHDDHSCVVLDSVVIDEPAVLKAQTISNDVTCYGYNDGNATSIVSGGTKPYSYKWGIAPVIDSVNGNLAKGNYSVEIADANLCIITQSYQIKEPDTMLLSVAVTPITCFNSCNGVVVASVSGGNVPYTFAWNGLAVSSKDSIATNTCDGTYSVSVLDAKGCSVSPKSFTLLNPLPLNIDSIITQNELCYNDCKGSIQLYSSGASKFSITGKNENNTGLFENLCKGGYTIKVLNNTGCIDSGTVNIFSPKPIDLKAFGDTSVCPDRQINLSANSTGGTGDLTFYWNGVASGQTGAFTSEPSVSTVYYVYAQDDNGCQSPIDSVIVEVSDSLGVMAFNDATICLGDSTSIFANAMGGDGNYTYSWTSLPQGYAASDSSFMAHPTNSTKYIVTLSDQCTLYPVFDTVDVTVIQPPSVDFSIDVIEKCLPGKVIYNLNLVSVDSTYNYLWHFGDGQTSADKEPEHIYYNSGVFSVSVLVTSKEGCTTEAAKKNVVTIYGLPKADFSSDFTEHTIHDPWFHFYNNSKDETGYLWDFGDSTNTKEEDPFHKYNAISCYPVELKVWNANGCLDSITKPVCVRDVYSFFVPNAFTPNGDNINDYFIPQWHMMDESTWHLMIFDRWGELIYETYDPYAYWNGRRNNDMRDAQIDVYVWKISHKDVWGNPYDYIGRVSVIR